MKIAINDHRKIFAIQEEFNSAFSNLKLEFYSKPHQSKGASEKEFIKHGKTLGECRTIHEDGNITITPHMTVYNVEQNFRDIYGLGVQVFRKAGGVWLETTETDGMTLEEQNKLGEVSLKE